MSKTLVLGDPHLSAEMDWQAETGRRIIKWLEGLEINNENNELILVGDLVDRYAFSPPSINLVVQFLRACRFHTVHMVVGNHDISQMEEESQQYVAYAFAPQMDSRFKIYEYPTTFKSSGLDVVTLPFYIAPTHSLVDLKPESSPMERWGIDYTKSYDVCIAHHFLKNSLSKNIPEELAVDVEALLPNVKKTLAGHIHTAELSPDQYTGSLYPKKIDEEGMRFYWVYDSDTDKWKKWPTPKFCELHTITYGEKIPYEITENRLPVYSVIKAPSKEKAFDYYKGQGYIRKVFTSWDNIRGGQGFGEMNPAYYSMNNQAMIPKHELLSRFETLLLEEQQEWKKFEVTKDTLKKAVDVIKRTTKEAPASQQG